MMNCINCGSENSERAVICYWCSLDPRTGDSPYKALVAPAELFEMTATMPEAPMPPPIEVPAPLPVAAFNVGGMDLQPIELTMPEPPPIEIAPPPAIPDHTEFTVTRRRLRHRPVVRGFAKPPLQTRPVLPGWWRLLLLIGGGAFLFVLGSALIATAGAASLGGVFCLGGLLVLAAVLWAGVLLARAGRRAVAATGAAYERIELLGRALYEKVPGVVKEQPINLPGNMGVLNLPLAHSELRALYQRPGGPALERAVDLLTSAIAHLVGRDDVVLARRTFPVETKGLLVRESSQEIIRPVLSRRRMYMGPGELEARIARALPTDQPVTVGEMVQRLLEPAGATGPQQVVAWADPARAEHPPDLNAAASPDADLQEFERFREAVRRADPELFQIIEDEIRRALGGITARSIPSSLLDLARYTSVSDSRPGQRRK